MSETTALWDRVCRTDPKHVKPITGKQYSGNSPKPYYIVRRLTEEFGPCGTGWGFEVLDERFERLSEHDVLHVARIKFWYGDEGACFEQMGQTKAAYLTSKGTLLVDEDAPKKSVTDALVKCASYLGFAGDIFMGQWDDSKYVAELRKEFSAAERADQDTGELVVEQQKQKRQGVMGAALPAVEAALDAKTKTGLAKLAFEIGEAFKHPTEGAGLAFDRVEIAGLESDEKLYLWSLLPSNIRSALKTEGQHRAMANVPN